MSDDPRTEASVDTDQLVAEITAGCYDGTVILKAVMDLYESDVVSTRWKIDTSGFGAAFEPIGVIDQGDLTLVEHETIEQIIGAAAVNPVTGEPKSAGYWWGDSRTYDPRATPKACVAVLTSVLVHRAGLTRRDAVAAVGQVTPEVLVAAYETYEVRPADPT